MLCQFCQEQATILAYGHPRKAACCSPGGPGPQMCHMRDLLTSDGLEHLRYLSTPLTSHHTSNGTIHKKKKKKDLLIHGSQQG